jgi:hypothetical protein
MSLAIKWLALIANKLIILKGTIFVAIMTLQVTPASSMELPVHLQCVGSQNRSVFVNWDGYPNKLIIRNQSLEMYLEQKSKSGHILRLYQVSDSNKKLALIELDEVIKIIYAEEGDEFDVECS